MDILSDVNIVGKLYVRSTDYSPIKETFSVRGGVKVEGHICAYNMYPLHIFSSSGTFSSNVNVGGCLSLSSSYLTKTISVPAQCTRFLLDEYDVLGTAGDEETNNKYPLVTAYRGTKKVDMDIEISYNRVGESSYTEFIIGNITSCSSPMNLKVSMLA